MDTNKKYQPNPIPKHKQSSKGSPYFAQRQTSTVLDKLHHEPFVEIEINQTNTDRANVSVPLKETVNAVVDEKRALFYSMRKIARDNMSFNSNHSKVFYYQALFMKDFEDNHTLREPFSCYFPYYQQMGYEQLRTYFTWRTQVRRGNITDISVSYAFLYIYELLNNIGVTDPQDGLDKLMAFWKAFRCYNTVIDRYVLWWLKDYHIYYPLSQSFQEFVKKHQLEIYYPTVFGYQCDLHNSFDLFADISKYSIKKSVFYNDQTHQMMNNCFYYILKRFRDLFKEKDVCFEDLIFYTLANESTWTPFNRSLFYPVLKQPDRQVSISKKEIYTCRNNHWTYKTVILSDQGRRLVDYIMKEMESSLRKAVKFKYKLNPNPDMCDHTILIKLKNMGISFPQFIQECVKAFYLDYTRKIISVDVENLKQIRQEALHTQEKLIVPDEIDDIKEKRIEHKEPVIVPPVIDNWTQFKGFLTKVELEALRIILCEKDIKVFSVRNMIMPEVLIDGINQKAMDYLGDIILELDDTVIVYEEYRKKLMEMVKY